MFSSSSAAASASETTCAASVSDAAQVVSKTALVLQKEYLFAYPGGQISQIGTYSVRGCCAVFIHHPRKSAVLHWDDNICHNDIHLFLNEFLGEPERLSLRECKVTLIGGWSNSSESKRSGEFLKDFFEAQIPAEIGEAGSGTLDLTYFLKKKEGESAATRVLAEEGFFSLIMNVQTGQIAVGEDWPDIEVPVNLDNSHDWGEAYQDRLDDGRRRDLIELEADGIPNSGTHIYHRDRFIELRNKQAIALCRAARDGDMENLIKILDEGIILPDTKPTNAKGCTALHYACKHEQYEAALVLIQNGANLEEKNDHERTPLDLMPRTEHEAIRKLRVAFHLTQYKRQCGSGELVNLGLFARGHGRRLPQEQIAGLMFIKEQLNTGVVGLNNLEMLLEMLRSGSPRASTEVTPMPRP